MTVGELGERMGCDEFMTWIVRDEMHVGESWEQSALLRHLVAQVAGNNRAKYEDFLPPRRKASRPVADLAARFAAGARGYNARVVAAGYREPSGIQP